MLTYTYKESYLGLVYRKNVTARIGVQNDGVARVLSMMFAIREESTIRRVFSHRTIGKT
jgi:hypothetical protein